MMKKLTPKKVIIWLLMVILGYHAIFGAARVLIDFKYPMGSYINTIIAFGPQLRIGIRYYYKPYNPSMWFLEDVQPEEQSETRSDFIASFAMDGQWGHVGDAYQSNHGMRFRCPMRELGSTYAQNKQEMRRNTICRLWQLRFQH